MDFDRASLPPESLPFSVRLGLRYDSGCSTEHSKIGHQITPGQPVYPSNNKKKRDELRQDYYPEYFDYPPATQRLIEALRKSRIDHRNKARYQITGTKLSTRSYKKQFKREQNRLEKIWNLLPVGESNALSVYEIFELWLESLGVDGKVCSEAELIHRHKQVSVALSSWFGKTGNADTLTARYRGQLWFEDTNKILFRELDRDRNLRNRGQFVYWMERATEDDGGFKEMLEKSLERSRGGRDDCKKKSS